MYGVITARHCAVCDVGLARRARYFLLFAQEKVSKEKGTPCRLASPVLLLITGGNQTRPNSLQKTQAVAELEQVMAEPSRADCAARRGRGG